MLNCCGESDNVEMPPIDAKYRWILCIALLLNAALFGVELKGGLSAGSVSLQAAALGLFGSGTGWSEIMVASIMGVLGISAARSVIWHARGIALAYAGFTGMMLAPKKPMNGKPGYLHA